MLQLAEIEVGLDKKILDISAESMVRERLLEMGLSPGRTVKVLRRLPFSGPIIVQAGHTTVALRLEEAQKIWVEP